MIVVDSMARIPLRDISPDTLAEFKEDLTFKVKVDGGSKTVRAWEVQDDVLVVPRNTPLVRDIIDSRDGVFEDRRSYGSPVDLRFRGAFREGQAEFVADAVAGLEADEFGVVAQAPCGYGKAVCAAVVAARVGVTSLFLAHKDLLLDQFAETCRWALGVEVGRVQGPTVDYQGRSIVVATLQSLYQKDYPQEFYDYFGLVIVDEVHHCPSRAFSLAISKVNARWRCGLSATPSRKDGLDDLIFYAMGDIAAYGRGQFVDCDVFVVPYSPPSWMRERDYVGNKGFSQIIKYLTRDAERNKILVRVITGAASKPGNKVLVLTKRVKQAELLTAAVASIVGEDQVGFFPAGKTKKLAEARASARSKNVTILTWQLGSEGVDFPEKNFLVVTAPSPDIEQAVGRVRRIYPGKERVNVVYLADELAFLPRITQKVIRFCERPGPDKGRWPVRWVDL